jgi:hypothetical protein
MAALRSMAAAFEWLTGSPIQAGDGSAKAKAIAAGGWMDISRPSRRDSNRTRSPGRSPT